MAHAHVGIPFFIELAKAHAIMSRTFDARLGGLGFTEFIILYHLNQSEEGKMRRTDLAEKVGLTPSGITRLLLPMEKIGLIKRQIDKHDARVSYVALRGSGKEKLEEGIDRAEILIEDLVPEDVERKTIEECTSFLKKLS